MEDHLKGRSRRTVFLECYRKLDYHDAHSLLEPLLGYATRLMEDKALPMGRQV